MANDRTGLARRRRRTEDEPAPAPELQLRRNSSEAQAARATTLFSNPEFEAAFSTTRQETISAMEEIVLDGSPESARKAVELVRRLQELVHLKRVICRPLLAQFLANAAVNKA